MNQQYKLFNGDCLEVMKYIPDNSVNLVLIDPPYNISKAKWDKWKTVEDYVEFMGKVFKEIERVLKPNGSFYFFHNDFLQIVELQNWINKNTDFVFRQLLVWNKRFNEASNKGFLDGFCEVGGLRNYQQMAEYCLFYTFNELNNNSYRMYLDKKMKENNIKHTDKKTKKLFVENGLAKNEESARIILAHKLDIKYNQLQFITKKQYDILKDILNFDKTYEELKEKYKNSRYTFNNQKQHHSVMNYEVAKKQGHITPKPVGLLECLIKTSSNKNDVVLDCFMGSGSTGVACMNTNRRFIGIELDENYFNIAKNRIENSLLLED